MPRGGDFCFAFSTRGQSFALKSCPGAVILMEKLVAWGSAWRGGMVTSQIDTCIRIRIIKHYFTFIFISGMKILI